MRKVLVNDIRENGLKNPLSCIDLGDNIFQVTVGNQRLNALQFIEEVDRVPCIISTLDINSIRFEVEEVTDFNQYFLSGINRVCLKHNIFQIVPSDTNKFDPHKRSDV